MAKELTKMIEDSLGDVESNEGSAKEKTYNIWRNIMDLYRLRAHEDHFMKINLQLIRLGSIVMEKYPTLGRNIQDSLLAVFNSEGLERELFSDIYSSMDLRLDKTPTETEEWILNTVSSFDSIKLIPKDGKISIMAYLESDQNSSIDDSERAA